MQNITHFSPKIAQNAIKTISTVSTVKCCLLYFWRKQLINYSSLLMLSFGLCDQYKTESQIYFTHSVESTIIIIPLMFSDWGLPKVITLSHFHCISLHFYLLLTFPRDLVCIVLRIFNLTNWILNFFFAFNKYNLMFWWFTFFISIQVQMHQIHFSEQIIIKSER
jgi:hypothetical protein